MNDAEAQPKPVVTIEWDDGPISVVVEPRWSEHLLPEMVLQEALQKTQAFTGMPAGGHSWRSQLTTLNVPLTKLKEFNQLIDEARAEEDAEPQRQPTQVTTRHLQSLWHRGAILGLTGDPKWMVEASRQALCDELLEVLTPPQEEDSDVPTTARDRIVRFMGGAR